jgi:hypothetical protein
MSKIAWVRIALLAVLVLLFQGTWALAGTTGALNGVVSSKDGTPLAGVKVTASSPSESVSTITSSTGNFTFVSLAPDTYDVTASKDGYDTTSQPGVSVFADNTQSVKIEMQASTKILGHITTTAASALVKAGTTSDVYSVSAATQAKVASLGGGGSLDAAYGAIASTPGVVVPSGQSGWFQTIHIRGGDFDQVGYEFDGVPVLRSYDNYPTTTASALGQQELQVYTGAAPASSESQGLAGYINQVIRNGTYPGFGELSLGIGSPTLYNKAAIEVGGATPDRNFTYFVGIGGYHQSFRWFDNSNGAGIQNTWGTPFANEACPGGATSQNFRSCYATGIGPGGVALAPPVDSFNTSDVWDYENILNMHFGLPHKNDAGKDDIQVLYDNSYLHNTYYSSASDWGVTVPGLLQNLNGGPVYGYLSGPGLGYEYLGKVGAPLASGITAGQLAGMVSPAYFPYNPNSQKPSAYFGGALAAIDPNQRDGTANPNSIIKVQYQKNIGTSSYFRIYAYNNYSEWPQTCPNTGWTNYIGYCPLNYYVQTTTNGVSASYASQINDKNLINIEVGDTFAHDYRANDTTMYNDLVLFGAPDKPFLWAVNSSNPTNGVCYTPAGAPVSCYSSNAATVGLAAANGGSANLTLPASCGTGTCEWFAAENGYRGGGNQADPTFLSASITDQWKPTGQLLFNYGVRFDSFRYKLSNTGGPARNFWFNSLNSSWCVVPGAGNTPFYNNANDAGLGNNQPCPIQNGVQTIPIHLQNLPNDTTQYNEFEPRIGGTYTVNPDNVLRFSYGKYTQAPNTAYEQYNLLQQDLASYDATNFWKIGFNTTTHQIRPPTSNNYDFSWEHQSGDISFKLTPFLRQTKDQIQNFFLDQKTGFVSGLNAGRQTSDGVEFELTKGDFNHNGLSGLVSATFTRSLIKYSPLQNGGSVLSTVNVAIQQYNGYTSACAGVAGSTNPNARCGAAGGLSTAFPCFVAGVGTSGAGCAVAGAVANPYYNAPVRGLFDLNGTYLPFSTIPGVVEAASGSYETPFTATFVLNFKHDKFSISPQFQFFEGGYYGDPLTGYGFNPATCAPLAGGTLSGDPRYSFGGSGNPADAMSCGPVNNAAGLLATKIPTPDPITGQFDNLGAFRAPNQLLMHMQISYDVSPRAALTLNLANIVNTCSGGTSMPWTRFANNKVCGYTLPGYGAPLTYGSNFYNPGGTFQPMLQYPYQENPTIQPFNAYLTLKIKL